LQIKEGLHTAFKNAVDKLHSKLVDVAALKNIDDDADKAVDDVVGQSVLPSIMNNSKYIILVKRDNSNTK